MADQRIQYTEEMVGAGHPTKSDTLNRLSLVEHNTDGTHKDISATSVTASGVVKTNSTGTLDVAAGKTVNVDDNVTVSAELHVEAATHVNQDLTSDASPTFAGVNTAAITAPSNSLVIKPTTDATTAVQVQDKDGNAILTVDTTNDRVGIGTTSPTSPLHGAGATSLGYTTITSSGTAGNYTTYFLNASSGEVILTLPAAATYAGRIYHIVRVQTYPSAYNCIVACQSGEYINGEASLALENNYDRVTAQSNGTGWIILGR